jgi:hypothetical protein
VELWVESLGGATDKAETSSAAAFDVGKDHTTGDEYTILRISRQMEGSITILGTVFGWGGRYVDLMRWFKCVEMI